VRLVLGLLLAAAAWSLLPSATAHAGGNPPPEGAVRCPDVLEGEVSVRLIYVVNLDCPSARQLGIDSAYESDSPEGWTCDGHSGVFIRWRYHLNLQCTDGIRHAQWVVFAYPAELVPITRPLFITANSRGPRRIGPLTRGNLTVERVYEVFGEPYRVLRIGRGDTACRATWPDTGLSIQLANFGAGGCEGGFAQVADINGRQGRRWRTNKGLRVGDSLSRLRRLYPQTSRHGSRWWLVRGQNPFARGLYYGVVSARVTQHRVRGLRIIIGGAGE
jgi:hypothetical protein